MGSGVVEGWSGVVWVVQRERQKAWERSCRGLERIERESRDTLFLLGCLYYLRCCMGK